MLHSISSGGFLFLLLHFPFLLPSPQLVATTPHKSIAKEQPLRASKSSSLTLRFRLCAISSTDLLIFATFVQQCYDDYDITRQWKFFSSVINLWNHHCIRGPSLSKTLLRGNRQQYKHCVKDLYCNFLFLLKN